MKHREIERYGLPVRVLHWIHSGAFVVLFFTGLMQFIPELRFGVDKSLIHLIHRDAAAVFIVIPLIYLVIRPVSAVRGLKQAFIWSRKDFGWFRAAPRYYLLGNDKTMPPQDFLNSGQKMWWLFTVVFGLLFTVSGLVMQFGGESISTALLQRMLLVHDVSFIVTGAMFLLHVYLALFRPESSESLKAMTGGKISTEYAEKHHGRWYRGKTGQDSSD